MNNEIYNFGAFPVSCPNCEQQHLYPLVDYPKDAVCPNCKQNFSLSEHECGEFLYLLSMHSLTDCPAATLKLKPLCKLLKKAAEEKKPYIRLYSVKDPSKNASFPLLALFAAPHDKTEEYSYLGSIKTW